MRSGIQKTIVLVIMAAAIAVAVYFGYINRRASSSEEAIAVGEVQDILLLDLDAHYPPTARETVNYFCRIYKAIYGENASEDQIAGMGEKLKQLFDDELIDFQYDYESELIKEARRKKGDGYTISSYRVQSASETVTKRVDGNDLTYVSCMITMRKGSQLNAANYLFVLRKETGSGRWKIFGWTVTGDED